VAAVAPLSELGLIVADIDGAPTAVWAAAHRQARPALTAWEVARLIEEGGDA
jgi:hypothetical protein